MSANLENSVVATGLEKTVFILIPKGNAKESSNDCTTAVVQFISPASEVMLKARLHQCVS